MKRMMEALVDVQSEDEGENIRVMVAQLSEGIAHSG
jgi:hypothetical protein